MADLLLKLGNAGAAEKYYREAVLAGPLNFRAHYNYGLQLVRKNDLSRAIDEFRQAILSRPDYSLAYDGLGVALLRSGDLSGSKSRFLPTSAQNRSARRYRPT